jgi:putative transposase
MVTTAQKQNRYDHRLLELDRATQDIRCAIEQGVPASTARGWLKAPVTEVITIDVVHLDVIRLPQEVLQLRARLRKWIALLRVVLVVLKLSG